MKKGKLVVCGVVVMLVMGCATKYDMQVKYETVLGVPVASIQEEAKNPMTMNRHQTTLVQEVGGKLEQIATTSGSGDGVSSKMLTAFAGAAPIGAGIGTTFLGRTPDQYSNSTNVQGVSNANPSSSAEAGAGALSYQTMKNSLWQNQGQAMSLFNQNTNKFQGGWIPPGQNK